MGRRQAALELSKSSAPSKGGYLFFRTKSQRKSGVIQWDPFFLVGKENFRDMMYANFQGFFQKQIVQYNDPCVHPLCFGVVDLFASNFYVGRQIIPPNLRQLLQLLPWAPKIYMFRGFLWYSGGQNLYFSWFWRL